MPEYKGDKNTSDLNGWIELQAGRPWMEEWGYGLYIVEAVTNGNICTFAKVVQPKYVSWLRQ